MALHAAEVRTRLLTQRELALFDLRSEAQFAAGHPLFAAQLELSQLEQEVHTRLPRKDVAIVLYDGGKGLISAARERLAALGFRNVHALAGDLDGWREAGYELFQDVNSYSKAFGELVEARRHTPSLAAQELHGLIEQRADIAILDARRFDEYATMNIPGSSSVPGAELVLRAGTLDAATLVVNCAGRTRSIIGAQSLINAGVPQRVFALRNGTIGWTLAGQALQTKQARRVPLPAAESVREALERARAVSYRAGVRRIGPDALHALEQDAERTLYRFDVRTPEEHAAGHLPGFRSAPGGQLVQETDMFAPVRGARIVLADELGVRAHMTASWLAQQAWEVYVLEEEPRGLRERGIQQPLAARTDRYKRPYEGTDNAAAAMQAYLDWEYGLVAQLERDATHGFFVI